MSEEYETVGTDGIYRIHQTEFYETAHKIAPLSSMFPKIRTGVTLSIPKIPAKTLIDEILPVMRRVASQHGAECLFGIYCCKEAGSYLFLPPKQKVTMGYVRKTHYAPSPPKYQRVGSIHSHIGPAGHSFIDNMDEVGDDGMHITIGDPLRISFSISCSLVDKGRRYYLRPEEVFDISSLPMAEEIPSQIKAEGAFGAIAYATVMGLGMLLMLLPTIIRAGFNRLRRGWTGEYDGRYHGRGDNRYRSRRDRELFDLGADEIGDRSGSSSR